MVEKCGTGATNPESESQEVLRALIAVLRGVLNLCEAFLRTSK
jgi:hypothetical protein